MAELSPAAKMVDDATGDVEARIEFTNLAAGFNAYRNAVAAAALRAAADQVVPEQMPELDHADLRQNRLRHELLAIAAELENNG